jgi:two-component system sensor histidine kinase/response regulator
LEAAGAIRKFEAEHGRRPTPIIALSANVMSAEKANAFAAGMDGYVSKPIDMRQLRNEIERVMHASNADSKVEIDLVGRSAQLVDIDSENGISVWGERSVYDQQLRRFVVDVRGYRKQLNDCLLAKDMVALKFLTHRIRGASGNLCLPRLSSVAAEVENNIDSMALDGGKRAGVALFSAIDSLDKAFEAYEATVPVSPAAEVQNKVDIGQVHSILDSLLPQLAAGRLNDKLLDQLYPMLPPRVAGAVRDDINAFKFIKACRTLTDHKTSLLSAS